MAQALDKMKPTEATTQTTHSYSKKTIYTLKVIKYHVQQYIKCVTDAPEPGLA